MGHIQLNEIYQTSVIQISIADYKTRVCTGQSIPVDYWEGYFKKVLKTRNMQKKANIMVVSL